MKMLAFKVVKKLLKAGSSSNVMDLNAETMKL